MDKVGGRNAETRNPSLRFHQKGATKIGTLASSMGSFCRYKRMLCFAAEKARVQRFLRRLKEQERWHALDSYDRGEAHGPARHLP